MSGETVIGNFTGSATENTETEEYDSEYASDADVSDVETEDEQTLPSDLPDISEQPVENAANENNEI